MWLEQYFPLHRRGFLGALYIFFMQAFGTYNSNFDNHFNPKFTSRESQAAERRSESRSTILCLTGKPYKADAPSIFLALNFCSLTYYQNIWHNCSFFVKTSLDPN